MTDEYQLWLVENENSGYDELRSAIVCARSSDEAGEMFKTHPDVYGQPKLVIAPLEPKPGIVHAHVIFG